MVKIGQKMVNVVFECPLILVGAAAPMLIVKFVTPSDGSNNPRLRKSALNLSEFLWLHD